MYFKGEIAPIGFSFYKAGIEIEWVNGQPSGLAEVLVECGLQGIAYFISVCSFSSTVFSWINHIVYSWRTFRGWDIFVPIPSWQMSSPSQFVLLGFVFIIFSSMSKIQWSRFCLNYVTPCMSHGCANIATSYLFSWSGSADIQTVFKIISTIILCRIQSFLLSILGKNQLKNKLSFLAARAIQLEMQSHYIYGKIISWPFPNLQYVGQFIFHPQLSFLIHILQIF